MGKKTKFAALALGACMALGLFCFTACEGTPGKSAYDIWIEQGNTGTEQDFLDSLKGTPGKAPEITVGENGNWFVDGVDTHQKAQGNDGTTPEITISDDGYWEINGEKTSQKAQGNDGTTPEITISDDGYWEVNGEKTSQKAQGNDGAPGAAGTNGTEWHLSDTNPTESEGEVGDFWLNKTDWTVWHKKSKTEWENLGTIKGKDGSGGVTPAEGTAVDIAADGNKEISVNLSEGTHIIVADLGSAEFAGRVQVHVGSEVSELVKSESRSTVKGSNIYYGYINVKEDTKTINIYAIKEAFKATINFEDYAMPTIEVGTAVEMPINVNGTAADSQLKVKIGTSVQESTKYSISIIADSSLNSMLKLNLDGEQLIMITMYGDASKTTNLTINAGKLSTGEHYFSLIHLTGSSGGNIKAIYPALVTLTEAA